MEVIIAADFEGDPRPPQRVSANHYDDDVVRFLDADTSGLYLDLGAGLRHEYRSHVVNVDIAALATTDVIAAGERLPFDDATFDGAVCLSVLQHVVDPFAVASELLRVVRPGGVIVVDWAFLQPVNHYPAHLYNATPAGAEMAFARTDLLRESRSDVPLHMHPVFALTWFLAEWSRGLDEDARAAFADVRVGDLVNASPHGLLDCDWVAGLSTDARERIGAGSRVWLVRR